MRNTLPWYGTLASLLVLGPMAALVATAPPGQKLPPDAEALSLDGEPLFPVPLMANVQARLEANLAEAQDVYDRTPADPDAAIWVGRRLAYLGRYQDAIAIYTDAIAQHPEYAKLYRHRGHRYITVRRFSDAIADLEEAARLIKGLPDEVEPDGAPNERNIPTSTSHTNIWYHLGLAYYLTGDLERARDAYRECLVFSKNADMIVATSHWLYMTLQLLGETRAADQVLQPIQDGMDIVENGSYYRLLLMYKGLIPPELILERASADGGIQLPTSAYGVANWHLYNGRQETGLMLLYGIAAGNQWAAFGHIAAEADLYRVAKTSH
ncbi:MAG: hypothetical protein CL489_07660 [Acidobacteria bacterium]|nr:hypothetical protein [Acidobacteriota bacterium]